MVVIAPDPATIKTIMKVVEKIADPMRKAHAMQLTGKIAKRALTPQKELSAKQKSLQVETKNPQQDANRETARERQTERGKGRDFELGD